MSIADSLNKEFTSTQEFARIMEEAVKEEITKQLGDALKRVDELNAKVNALEVKANTSA